MSVSETQIGGSGRSAPEARELAKSTGDAARTTLARAARSVRSQAGHYAGAVQSQTDAARQKALATIRERPATSVLGALGVGLLGGIAIGVCTARTWSH